MIRTLVATIITIAAGCVLTPAGAQAHPSWGIAVDRQGQVYFSDLKTVWRIDAQGKLSVFRAGNDRHTHDLNIDDAGNVYGADNSYDSDTERFFGAIWKMTPTGSFSYLLAPTDNLPAGTSIWRDRDGNTYHAENYPEGQLLVLKRSPGGNVSVLVGNSNALRNYHQGAPYSVGMAFGADGSLFFTHGSNASRVTMSGILTALARNVVVENAPGNPPEASPLFGIAVDAQGNALVADHGNRRILKIAPDGQLSTLICAEESWFPTGVAVRGNEIYILEESHTPTAKPIGTRVRKLTPGGTVRVLATVGENSASSGDPSAGETPSAANPAGISETKGNVPYALIGAGAGFFVLSVITWRLLRGMSDRGQKQ